MKRSLGNQMNLFTDMNLCSLFLWRAAYQHSFNLRLVPTAKLIGLVAWVVN